MTMFEDGTDAEARYDFIKTVQAQRMPMGAIKPVVTTVGEDNTLHLSGIYNDLGPDVIIGIGGAIQGHPGGTTSGAMQ